MRSNRLRSVVVDVDYHDDLVAYFHIVVAAAVGSASDATGGAVAVAVDGAAAAVADGDDDGEN